MVIMIHDEKAEKLEQAGLYRRAAARWLTVLDGCRDEDAREWAARQRLRCLQQAETPRPVTDTFGDVRQAATALQKKMGLWQPEGDAFRTVKKHPPR
ncbi:PerC family transcriptional regulator [Salmonella enterica]